MIVFIILECNFRPFDNVEHMGEGIFLNSKTVKILKISMIGKVCLCMHVSRLNLLSSKGWT